MDTAWRPPEGVADAYPWTAMAKFRFTLDDAAVRFAQLEADDAAGLRRLRDQLKRLARRTTAGADDIQAAAGALDRAARAARAAGPSAAAAFAEAGRAIEAAMVSCAAAAPPCVPARSAQSSPAIDRLMLAALAQFDAEESAEAREAERSPEHRHTDGMDADLLESFVAESIEYLQHAEESLLRLEAGDFDAESVNRVFRCFHTIKGTSTFLGLERVSGLAHRAESLMSRVRDRTIRLEGEYADLVLRSVDVLRTLLRSIGTPRTSSSGPPAGFHELMRSLADAATAGTATGAAAGSALQALGKAKSGHAQDPGVVVGAVGGEAEGTAGGGHAVEAFTRVRTDRLDRLIDAIGELVIAHSMIAQDAVVQGHGEDQVRKVAHAEKIVRELQDLGMAMRMVPLKALFRKLTRLCRDTATKSGKEVAFVTEGEDTELDRNMVDVLGDPLVHMVRNAVDHGIELPEDRERAGKPARGMVRLRACHAGGNVVVTLSDDGRGLDRERITASAVSRGLVEGGRTLTDREMHELIFSAGFSTVETVTALSGRGVGMDVVRRNVEALRGRCDIESAHGRGSTFTMRLPLTLAITDGMLVRVGAERYVLPTVSIQLSFRPEPSALSTDAGRGEMVLLRDEVLPIVRLHDTLGIAGAEADPTKGILVVVGSAGRRSALLVDELLGQQQVVAKSLGNALGKVPGVSGGAILGDGRIGLILDVTELLSVSRSGATAVTARDAA